MLVIHIEMWPGGRQEGKSEIGRMYVHNVSNLTPVSNYRGWVCRRGTYEPVRESKEHATRTLEVTGYPRERLNVWCLVTRALLSAFPEEGRRAKRGEATDGDLRRVAMLLSLPDEATWEEIEKKVQDGSGKGDQNLLEVVFVCSDVRWAMYINGKWHRESVNFRSGADVIGALSRLSLGKNMVVRPLQRMDEDWLQELDGANLPQDLAEVKLQS